MSDARPSRGGFSTLDLLLSIDPHLLRTIGASDLRYETFAVVVRHGPAPRRQASALVDAPARVVAYYLATLLAMGALEERPTTLEEPVVRIAPPFVEAGHAVAAVGAGVCDVLGDEVARRLSAILQEDAERAPLRLAQVAIRADLGPEGVYRRCLQLASAGAITMNFDGEPVPGARWSASLAETVRVALTPMLLEPSASSWT